MINPHKFSERGKFKGGFYKMAIIIVSMILLLSSGVVGAFDPSKALQELRQHEAASDAMKELSKEKILYRKYTRRQQEKVNEDGTVTIGNLQWMRCSLGETWESSSCMGSAVEVNWNDAKELPGLMNNKGGYAGRSDWRLPTISELAGLRVCSSGRAVSTRNTPDGTTFRICSGDFSRPTIDTHLFPGADGWFWSSTLSYLDESAWYVYFGLGHVYQQDLKEKYRVRLVREK